MFRIGHGYDIHRTGSDKPLVLGGLIIANDGGLVAHSDGDVVLHALMDALLGAMAAGDIGHHFPDHDEQFQNADSRHLLNHVMEMIIDHGYKVQNCDITIIAEKPKLAPFLPEMKQHIAEDLKVNMNAVNVKATTHEGCDAVGNEQAIAAHAVVLLGNGS